MQKSRCWYFVINLINIKLFAGRICLQWGRGSGLQGGTEGLPGSVVVLNILINIIISTVINILINIIVKNILINTVLNIVICIVLNIDIFILVPMVITLCCTGEWGKMNARDRGTMIMKLADLMDRWGLYTWSPLGKGDRYYHYDQPLIINESQRKT